MMKIFFIVITLISGFFLGIFTGGIAVPKNSGLAGGATVLGYGVIGGIIALTLAIIFVKKIEPKLLKKITIFLLILNLIPLIWIIYKFNTNRSIEDPVPQRRTVTPTLMLSSLSFSNISKKQNENFDMGLGMVKPNFYKKRILYFYSPNLEKDVSEHLPYDSLVFKETDNNQYSISYAPPWFYPEHLKMDYEILYLKILTLSRDWIQVEVNKQTQLSSWLSVSDVQILLWPDFLLSVFDVEIIDQTNNPLRIKPLLHASTIPQKKYSYLSPIMVKESWLKVRLLDNDYTKVGEAWLRWHDGNKLLIRYSLLS